MGSSSILGIGQSALHAAQTGLVTTGHNIANVNTPGYSRQVVIQGAAPGQDVGVGFIGKGADVVTIRRVFNEFLHNQVVSQQVSKSAVDSYYAQIKQIDNMLADPKAGVSGAMQEFFESVQDVGANRNDAAARQAMLSSSQALAARFQSIGNRLDEMRQSINGQITTSIGVINTYAQQIATLNDAIEKAQGTAGEGKPANDLLDQRDQLIADLSKEIKVSVVKQGNSYNVFIGNGQALTVGTQVFKLTPVASQMDTSKLQIGYVSNGKVSTLADNSLPGGRLGGLLEFRNNSLDPAQNSLGRMAIGLAHSFNAQHRLGQDQTGALGGAFFTVGDAQVTASSANSVAPPTTAAMTATITDASKLTVSDYRLTFDGATNRYTVTRLSDNTAVYGPNAAFPSGANVIEGVTLSSTGVFTPGRDAEFLIRPTVAGATKFGVAINDTTKIAAAEPLRTSTGTANSGNATITPSTISSTVLLKPTQLSVTHNGTAAPGGLLSGFPAGSTIAVKSGGTTTTYPAGTASVPYNPGDTLVIDGVNLTVPTTAGAHTIARPNATLTFNGGNLTGFPPGLDVTVTGTDGTVTTHTGGTVPYQAGATISYGGLSFTMSGTPAENDTFVVGNNTGGVGDNRNALRLAELQTKNTLGNGTMSYSGAYNHMVSQVGNKTAELEAMSKAEAAMLEQAMQAHQAESGVNLDEEAANLMRYQQAYQAAAKVMQTASQLFDLLLNLGA